MVGPRDSTKIGMMFSISIALLLFVSQTALADEIILQQTANIEEGGYFSRSYDAQLGEEVEIDLSCNGDVDIIMTSEKGFGEYTDPLEEYFEYYPGGSSLDVRNLNLSFEVPGNAKYYVIIDNTEIPDTGASPVGDVNCTVMLTRTGEPFDPMLLVMICGGIVAVIVFVVVFAVYVYYYRRPKKEEKPTYEHSPIYDMSIAKGPMNCPKCGTFSSSGPYCVKCGRRLR